MESNRRELPQRAAGTGMVGRYTSKNSLRPLVLFFGGIASLWSLLAAIAGFRLHSNDDAKSISDLTTIALALGIVYIVAMLIEIFGVTAAVMQRMALVRIYALLSVVSSILLLGGSLTEIVIHFTKKDGLINTCADESTGDIVFVGFGWGGFSHGHSNPLNHDEALAWCKKEWNHDSWSNIVAFLVEIVLALLFVYVNFGYYRQLADPTSPANVSHTRPQTYPEQYNPPYAGNNFQPPPGPPPSHPAGFYDASETGSIYAPAYDGNKLPGYDGYSDAKEFNGDKKDPNDKFMAENPDKAAKGENPFADFDEGPSPVDRRNMTPGWEERDLASAPRPGERDAF